MTIERAQPAMGIEKSSRVDAESAAVAQARTALLNAVNLSDLPAVVALWCDDGVLMPPHHPSVHGRSAIQQYFERLFRRGRFQFAFTSSQIELAGDVALERVEYTAAVSPADGSPEVRDVGKGLHVYRRQPDRSWRLAMDIWSSDNPIEPDV
jgi:uncharacterized protein (TIGR02246 family)